MLSRQEVFSAIAERRCPMVLVPEHIKEAVAEMNAMTPRYQRWRIIGNCAFLSFFASVVILIAPNKTGWFITFVCLLVSSAVGLFTAWSRERRYNTYSFAKKPIEKLGKSLNEFADEFAVLMDAFEGHGDVMGEWTSEQVRGFAKGILHGRGLAIKCLELQHPKDRFVGAEEIVEFKQLHEIFDGAELDMGPYDPYFEDEQPPRPAA